MTMPTDADDAVESSGSNDGPRENDASDVEMGVYVDEQNVPHPVSNPEDEDNS